MSQAPGADPKPQPRNAPDAPTPTQAVEVVFVPVPTSRPSSLQRFAGCSASGTNLPMSHAGPVVIPEVSSLPTIPGYEILKELGRGGLGVVYLARHEQLQRLVALKMLLAGGHASPLHLQRLRAEAEAVAQLQHPNIVQIYEVGVAEGKPYLALEYIQGQTLGRHLANQPQKERPSAALIETLARAIEFAHGRGIIHRDLKPDNVLLESKSDHGTAKGEDAGTSLALPFAPYAAPKITDFGLAKRLDLDSGLTGSGMALGTPSYMAPEQARGDSKRIGPEADVYSLGAILYEMLTGRPPFLAIGWYETLALVCEKEPTPPHELQPNLSRDIETICLKCLQKEPRKRYHTAVALADDLRRFLDHQPIRARPVGTLERGIKWAKRQPIAAALAGVLLSVWAAALVVTTGLWWDADRERRRAEEAESQAQQAAAEAKAINRFFNEQVLTAARPRGQAGGLGKDATLKQAIDAAAPRIERLFPDQPLVEAGVQQTVGESYWYLGDYVAAERHLRRAWQLRQRALGDVATETLVSLNSLAIVLVEQGRLQDAEPLLRQSLDGTRRLHGPNHADSLTALNNLASILQGLGELGQAEELFRQSLDASRTLLGAAHPDTLVSMNNLAYVLKAEGHLAEAEPLMRQCFEARRRVLGNDHPDTLNTLGNLAGLLEAKGQTAAAETMTKQVLDAERRILGSDHPDTLKTQNHLACMLQDRGQLAEAETMFREILTIRRRRLPANHPDLAATLTPLGETLIRLNQPVAAESLLREALAIRQSMLPAGHRLIAETKSVLGGCLTALTRYDEAEPMLLESYRVLAASVGEPPQRVRETIERLVRLYDVKGDSAKADEWRKTGAKAAKP